MRILSRIVTWTKEGIEYEGDQRHVEICVQDLGLDKYSKEVITPCDNNRRREGVPETLREKRWKDVSRSDGQIELSGPG